MSKRFFVLEWAGIVMLCAFSVAAHTEEMTVNIFGRIHADAAIYDEDVTALDSGSESRRARPGASARRATVAGSAPPLTCDNFEGVEARQGARGETLITILSDDNFNPFQRTLLMMFELKE